MIRMTGIHGNEPAGPRAAQRVLERLERKGIEIRGHFIAFAGNLKALAEKTRFLSRDLNRQWTAEKVAALESRAVDHAEAEEQRELLAVLREQLEDIEGPVYFLDLHTTSAASPPFVTVGDTLRNRGFARSFPLPLILGLEEQVDGALLEYLGGFGLITMGAEAGQHDCDGSVDRAEALLWCALRRTGMLPSDAADVRAYSEVLQEASRGVPPVVEVRYRHAITDEDEFEMLPGFDNFVAVEKGQIVAHDRNGPVQAREDGLMLLPLYQGKGEDGFFIARPVRMFWLRLSGLVRRLRLHAFLHWLPGVYRSGDPRFELTVDTQVARWFALDILHLFGYRKQRMVRDMLVVTRRAFDLGGPKSIRMSR
jgi:succinylglutamate desuccinylase